MSNWGNSLLGNSYSEGIIKQKNSTQNERDRGKLTAFPFPSHLAPTERTTPKGTRLPIVSACSNSKYIYIHEHIPRDVNSFLDSSLLQRNASAPLPWNTTGRLSIQYLVVPLP